MFWGNTQVALQKLPWNIGECFPKEETLDLDPEDLVRIQPRPQLEEEANGDQSRLC